LIWIILLCIFRCHLNALVVALLLTFTMERVEVKFLVALRDEGGTGNSR